MEPKGGLISKTYFIITILSSIFGNPLKGRFYPIGPGTDLGLYNKGFFEGDIVPRVDMKNGVSDPQLLWPYGAVIYKTDDNVGCPESPQCEILMKAMDHYHQHTCIRFKEWTGEQNYVTVFFNPDSGACWSPVGRVGSGEQRLSLGQRCWYTGIVIHELGHAIGFWHEMNRPDRDEWIYVFWNNIIQGFASAFSKHDPTSVNTLGEKFDYKSIMMYDEYAFSKDGISPTVQAKVPSVVIGPIWKKPGLSDSDKRRIHKLYTCEEKAPKTGFPYDEICNFNKDACGFKNGGASVWNWRTLNSTDGYVYTSFDQAGTTPGYFMSINFHGVSESDSRGPMGCARFWYLLQGNCGMHLKVSQAYLKSPTQLFHDPDTMYELWQNDTATGEWVHVETSLYVNRAFKLVFESGFNETCTNGNIALDDIELFYTPCQSTSTTQHQTHTTFHYTNTTTGTTGTTGTTTGTTVTTTPTEKTTTRPPDKTVPTTSGIIASWQITDTGSPTVTVKPPVQSYTIFPPDFMKPSSTVN